MLTLQTIPLKTPNLCEFLLLSPLMIVVPFLTVLVFLRSKNRFEKFLEKRNPELMEKNLPAQFNRYREIFSRTDSALKWRYRLFGLESVIIFMGGFVIGVISLEYLTDRCH